MATPTRTTVTAAATVGLAKASAISAATSPSSAVLTTTFDTGSGLSVDQQAGRRLRRVAGEGQPGAQADGNGHGEVLVRGHGEDHGAGQRSQQGVDAVPDRVEQGDLVDHELDDEQGEGDADHDRLLQDGGARR